MYCKVLERKGLSPQIMAHKSIIQSLEREELVHL
jgi:hypothetical protein